MCGVCPCAVYPVGNSEGNKYCSALQRFHYFSAPLKDLKPVECKITDESKILPNCPLEDYVSKD